jgi:hypothetical protein
VQEEASRRPLFFVNGHLDLRGTAFDFAARAASHFAELVRSDSRIPSAAAHACRVPVHSNRRHARKHLGLAEPRKKYLAATAAVEPFAKRDEIESAVNHLMTVSDNAYFYAGLAFGVTLADYCAPA